MGLLLSPLSTGRSSTPQTTSRPVCRIATAALDAGAIFDIILCDRNLPGTSVLLVATWQPPQTDRLSQARGGDRLIRHRRERRRVLALDRPGWTERNPPPATTGRSRATKRRAAPTRARQRPSATIGFCDDFERATLLGSWTEASSAGGTLAIVGAPGFKYLEGEVAGRDAGAAAVAVLRKDFSATVTRVSLECDLAYDRRPTISNDGVIILKIKSATANAFQRIYLNVQADKSGFVLQDPSLAGGIEYRNIPFESGSRRVASRSTWRWRAERACASTAR